MLNNQFSRLNPISEFHLITKSLSLGLIKFLLFKKTRNENIVNQEYNDGTWSKVLAEKKWQNYKTIENFLISNDASERVVKINNSLYRTTSQNYYQFRIQKLREIFSGLIAHHSEVYELGAGYGFNVFTLASSFPEKLFIGLDFSKNAIKAAREIADHFEIKNVRFDYIDLRDQSSIGFSYLRGRFCFTYFSLEQLGHFTKNVIENLISSKASEVVHFEQAFECLDKTSAKDLLTYFHILRNDYQKTLLANLRLFENKGVIKILDCRRLYYSPTILNDPLFIHWKRKEN